MRKVEDIQSMAVVGAGVMGAGIAQMAAMCGLQVKVYDLSDEVLDRAKKTIQKNLQGGVDRGKVTEAQMSETIDRIQYVTDIKEVQADIILEAIIEKLEIKQKLFQDLAEQNSSETILATNTSSIPITRIASAVPLPERVVGMHFFNPAHIMKLVEVISGAATDPEIAGVVKQLAEKMGKKAVMAKDAPGFIVNRVARHFYVEGLKVLEENVASHEVIDDLLEASGFRMGPFKLMDLIGVETNFSVTTSMFESFSSDGKFRPSRIQQQKVDAGHWGRKKGKGFYDYSE